jgi:hypothetical protein
MDQWILKWMKGVLFKFVERRYISQGTYADNKPSNEVTHPF